MTRVERYSLPVWLRGVKATALYSGFYNWWDAVEGWIKTPFSQLDARTCSASLVKYYAYQRNVEIFPNEDEELYRKRVHFAAQNMQDAGSVQGFYNIFERLGVGEIEITERPSAEDWDVVTVNLTDQQITGNADLLDYIIRAYGRTCRRYQLTVTTSFDVSVASVECGASFDVDVGRLPPEDNTGDISIVGFGYGAMFELDVAV